MNDARYARLVDYAMTMAVTAGLSDLTPPADPRLAPDWTLCGHLTAMDHWGPIDRTVCYGFLVKGADGYAAVVRGTHGAIEWLEDADILPTPVPHPECGNVEDGFWRVYEAMTYIPLGGVAETVPAGLVRAVGDADLVVVGHSLGAALATYMAYDLAPLLKDRLSMRLFASPNPGDAEFCGAFDARCADYVVYAYEPDVVPKVPYGPDYTYLPNRRVIPRTPKIRDNIECFHAITTYEWLLDPTTPSSACIV